MKTIFSEPLDTAELKIGAMGVQEQMPPGLVHRSTGTHGYLFMLFYESVELDVAGNSVPPRTLILWGPGHAHLYGNRARRWKHTWIHCDGTVIAPLIRALNLPLGVPIYDADPAVAEHYFLRRRREGHRVGAQPPERLLKVKNYIEAHSEEPIRLADLAERAALSPQYLCSVFKRYFGVTPIDLLIRQRMQRAQYLLQDENLSVGEVGARVGYEDIFQFSKLFKKHMGVSPSRIRRPAG